MTNKPASKWLLLHSTMTNVGGVVIITHFVYKYIINGCVSVSGPGPGCRNSSSILELETGWDHCNMWLGMSSSRQQPHSLGEDPTFTLCTVAIFYRKQKIFLLVFNSYSCKRMIRVTRILGNAVLVDSGCWWWQPGKKAAIFMTLWLAIVSGLGSCQWFEKVMSQSWADSSRSPAQVRECGQAGPASQPADCMSN